MDAEPIPTVQKERALRALDYARRLSEGPRDGAELPSPPPNPTAEEWRALSVKEFRRDLDELIVKRNVEAALDYLQKSGAFAVWLPEVDAMVGFSDGEWRHKDVWKHTKQVVKQSVPRLEVRWGALLHDIGKLTTREFTEDGQVTFYGHSEVGASMYRRRVRKRLGFEGALSDRIHFLILHHLRASQYEESWTDAAVRRFYKQMGDGLRDLLDLSRADITTKRPEKRKRGVAQISALAKRVEALKAEDAKVSPLPKGLGEDIMREFGVPPSKRLGEIRQRLHDDAEAGTIEAGREIAYYLGVLREAPERYGLAG